VVEKIIYLRQNYHFGPAKISMYLKRYHDVQISQSGVWRILKRLDLSRLPAPQRYKRHDRKWKRYEKPMPGHAVQVDVKFIAPLASSGRKKYYQFTAIDDCTRLRVLRIYDRLNQKTAIQFADFLLGKFPFRVEVIQTDNGSEFRTAFHLHLLDRGIRHVYIKPATPRCQAPDRPSQAPFATQSATQFDLARASRVVLPLSSRRPGRLAQS
jgi:IS30 family transposase